MLRRTLLTAAVAGLAALEIQSPLGRLESSSQRQPAVRYLFPEQVSIAAGKPSAVDLHFKVGDGLHINSHTPGRAELIPTTLSQRESEGVRLAKAAFPPGTEFAFAPLPGTAAEKLSVYTGEFVVHAELISTPGEHRMEATLRYQACTNSICMPPHTVPVAVDVVAR